MKDNTRQPLPALKFLTIFDGHISRKTRLDNPTYNDPIFANAANNPDTLHELITIRNMYNSYVERTVERIENILNIELTTWQIEFIFFNVPYGGIINVSRCQGKTLAHILKLCLTPGEKINLSKGLRGASDSTKLLLGGAMGEDSCQLTRADVFTHSLEKIYKQLKEAGGIYLREIEF